MKYRNIIIYGNSNWQFLSSGNSAQQLSLAFLELGYRVIFIAPHHTPTFYLPAYPNHFVGLSVSRAASLLSANSILQASKAFFRNPISSLSKFTIFSDELRGALQRWNCQNKDTIFICNFADLTAKSLSKLFLSRKCRTVYRHVDWWNASHSQHGFSLRATKYICKHADVITISHPQLLDNLPCGKDRAILMQNGVNLSIFDPKRTNFSKPDDLADGSITVGFWGTYWGNCINWKLIHFLAERNRDWTINLIADLKYLDIEKTSLPPNVHLLGFKPTNLLPNYLHYFDVCLIPFRQDLAFAKYANPIKALEFLSGFKPIVSPVNKSLEHYPGVFFYNSPEEAERQIDLAKDTTLDRNIVLHFLNNNSWAKRVEALLTAINK